MKQVVRKKKNKSQHWLFFNNKKELCGFLFLLIVIGTFFWTMKTVYHWMDEQENVVISRLIITGDRFITTDDDIRQVIGALDGGNTFITQNVDIIQNEILRLPWIKQVSVRKQWPDTLKLHIVEYHPAAHWNNLQLLDEKGIIFNMPPERLEEPLFPYLYGPEGREKDVLNMYNQLNIEIQEENDLRITNLTVDERYSWKMTVNNKYLLELGRSNIKERLQRFTDLYSDIVKPLDPRDSLITIDLRYESGMAIDKNKRY